MVFIGQQIQRLFQSQVKQQVKSVLKTLDKRTARPYEPFVRAGLMIVPLADRLEPIVTFAFDESRGTPGAFEVEAFISEPELVELAVSNEL